MLRVPFWATVDLGVLPAADYKIVTGGVEDEALKGVSAINDGPDDHLYAPIESARVDWDTATNRYTAIIQGRFTNSCMAWSEVRVVD
jgi:hypothetical protein